MESQNTLIIYYDDTIGKEPLLESIEKYNAVILYEYINFNSVAIKIPEGTIIEDAITYFNGVEGVLLVNRDYINNVHYDLN